VIEQRVCTLAEIEPGTAKRVDVGPHAVALVRCGDEVFAIGDTCSHEKVSLSEGEVLCDDKELECWKHGSTFSLLDGEPQSLPATRPVPVYRVRLEGDDVVVVIE
jgi:3-phenylpropionate/trans-cinnamate dioxygenase ferredoxin subunit